MKKKQSKTGHFVIFLSSLLPIKCQIIHSFKSLSQQAKKTDHVLCVKKRKKLINHSPVHRLTLVLGQSHLKKDIFYQIIDDEFAY